MNEQLLQQIMRRLAVLERQMPRLRIGEVSDVGPLDVDLGDSGSAFEDVAQVGPAATGDRVAVLTAAHDLLVLGALGMPYDGGSDFCAFPGASQNSNVKTVSHGLGVTPSAVLLTGVGHPHVVHLFGTVDSDSIDVRISTRDESSPAAGVQSFFYWIAFR